MPPMPPTKPQASPAYTGSTGPSPAWKNQPVEGFTATPVPPPPDVIPSVRQSARDAAVAQALAVIRPEHLHMALAALGIPGLSAGATQPSGGEIQMPPENIQRPTQPAGPEANPMTWMQQMSRSGGLGIAPSTAQESPDQPAWDATMENMMRAEAVNRLIQRSMIENQVKNFLAGSQGLHRGALHPDNPLSLYNKGSGK